MKRKMMAATGGDRLSELPEAVLLHILSLLRNTKEIARTSVLSTQWRFLWKSVPLSLHLPSSLYPYRCGHDETFKSVASINRELYFARFFLNTRKLSIITGYNDDYAKDVGLWIHFATQIANVEDFTLHLVGLYSTFYYEFPQYAFKNWSLKNLFLRYCELKPCGSVSWTSLVSLSIGDLTMTDKVMEIVLSGCPNLECLELDTVWGICYLEISSPKLRTLTLKDCYHGKNVQWMEITTPHVHDLKIWGLNYSRPLQLKNVASLVTAFLDFNEGSWCNRIRGYNDKVDKECRYLKELLQILIHVKKLELGRWFIECLSILVLKGLQAPTSSRRILTVKAYLVQQDFPAICSLLQSSPDLETFVIDGRWWTPHDSLKRYINEDEDGKKFEKHIFDCSLLHLRTIKIINFDEPSSSNKFILRLVKYLLKNAEVLEKMVIAASLLSCRIHPTDDVSRDFVEMEQELLSFPRSSKHAEVVFSY